MIDSEQQAVLTLVLLAAFADGAKDRHERERIRRILDQLPGARARHARINADVMMRRASMRDAVAALQSVESRHLAHELAASVCDADGTRSASDVEFLESLGRLLDLPPPRPPAPLPSTGAAVRSPRPGQAASLPALPAAALPASPAGAPSPATPRAGGSPVSRRPPQAGRGSRPDRDGAEWGELDATIVRAAVLAGALERMPQPMASIAILPLQSRLVQAIARAKGQSVTREQARGMMNAVGLGLPADFIAGFGRKLFSGLARRIGGNQRDGGAVSADAASPSTAFAGTYALGQLAKAYVGTGNQSNDARMKAAFKLALAEGQALSERYAGAIARQAQQGQNLDMTKLMALVEDVR